MPDQQAFIAKIITDSEFYSRDKIKDSVEEVLRGTRNIFTQKTPKTGRIYPVLGWNKSI
jgi:hypothetical protein